MSAVTPIATKYDTARPNPYLCQQCQPWDSVHAVVDHFEPVAKDKSTLAELSSKIDCLICRAVLVAVNTRCEEVESFQARPPSEILIQSDGPYFLDRGTRSQFLVDTASRIDSSDSKRLAIKLIMNLSVSILPTDEISTDGALKNRTIPIVEMTPQFRLLYSKARVSQLISIEPWDIPFFDVSLLKMWIRGCEGIHKSKCVGDTNVKVSDFPPGFRVIDVSSMRIMRPVESVRFVALSYMWQQGGDENNVQLEQRNLEELESPNGISGIPLPNIISDAISLCKKLGENYLWVDRLCIIQDDANSKHDQIRGMDKIYRSAHLTIIVAVNSRNGQGIPGFQGSPRKSSIWRPSRDCEVEGRGLRELNGMSAVVNTSLWNKRGWTFQERVLSRRRLFITEFEVIFECARGRAAEELTYHDQRPYKKPMFPLQSLHHMVSRLTIPQGRLSNFQEKQLEKWECRQIPTFADRSAYGEVDYNVKDTVSLVEYFSWIEDYTSRQLSFGSDILKAFTGVSNQLSGLLSTRMIFGIPEKYLSHALMWSHFGAIERRTETQQIPSWSWASSRNIVDYLWILGGSPRPPRMKDITDTTSLVYFHFQDPQSGLRKLDVEERWLDNEAPMEHFQDHEEFFDPGVRKHVPGAWRSRQTWQQCPHNVNETLAHRTLDPAASSIASTMPGCLVFNTTVASLKLARDTREIYKHPDYPEQDVAICSANGECVGWVNKMSPQWISQHVDNERSCDFIVICGALADWSSRKTMSQFLGDYDMWRLHVMLVERLPVEPYVVRRVDVGYTFAHKWKDCHPRWETVILY